MVGGVGATIALGLLVLALNILPVGRLFLLLVALTPMTASVAGSFGQDGIVIGSCAMLIALAVRARSSSRSTAQWS
jgi:uncharacterized membrane protein